MNEQFRTQLVLCEKCKNFWKRGFLKDHTHIENPIAWYEIIGLTVDGVKINEKNHKIRFYGACDCPKCDTRSWVNRRSIDGSPLSEEIKKKNLIEYWSKKIFGLKLDL